MDIKKNIILLGATGSIGESSLRLIRKNKEKYNLIGVSAHNNVELLSKIVNEFMKSHYLHKVTCKNRLPLKLIHRNNKSIIPHSSKFSSHYILF